MRSPSLTRPEVVALLLVFALGCSVLLASLSVDPDPRGYGTHQQFQLAQCGFRTSTGLPCPTCGMTTSFAHFARMNVGKAFESQPLGALLCLLVFAATFVSLFCLVAGTSPRPLLRFLPRKLFLVLILLVLAAASWGWRILQDRS